MDKLPTIKEIARKLNISASTVSRALHNHPNIGIRTKNRVQELAKELNYIPNQNAIFFQKGKTNTLGIILPELTETFFSKAISGIEDAAHSEDYNVLLGQSHDSEEKEKQLVETFLRQRVDGLLISVGKDTVNYDHLSNSTSPIVFFDRIPKMKDIHSVTCNITNSTTQLISFLVGKGHRIIGLINGPEKLTASKDRLDGYINGLVKSRLKYDPNLVINCDLSPAETSRATEELLKWKRTPTAIIAFNDYVALDAVHQARKMKLKINKDICFASFANLPMNDYITYPPIATVEQFPYQQGFTAAKMLIELLKNPPNNGMKPSIKVDMEAQLVIR